MQVFRFTPRFVLPALPYKSARPLAHHRVVSREEARPMHHGIKLRPNDGSFPGSLSLVIITHYALPEGALCDLSFRYKRACWAHGELGRPLDPSRHAVTGSHVVVSLSQSVVYLRGAGKSASSEDGRRRAQSITEGSRLCSV